MRNSSSLDWLRFMHTPNDYRVSRYLLSFTASSIRDTNCGLLGRAVVPNLQFALFY